jgi:hypothetical protein
MTVTGQQKQSFIFGESKPNVIEPADVIEDVRLRDGWAFQEGEKPRNDVADKMGELIERWEQRISPVNRRFGERFLAGEIHILIAFRDTETDKVWFVRLERNSPDNLVFTDSKNKTVLVGVVQIPEQPERSVPVLVRLEPINRLYSLPPHTLYASSLSGFISVWGVKYRELNVRKFFGSGLSKAQANHDQLEGKMVKSTAKIMNHIASDGGDVESVDVQGAAIKAWLSSLMIAVNANRLEGSFTNGQDGRFKLIEVLFGPFNFYSDESKSIVGGHACSCLKS